MSTTATLSDVLPPEALADAGATGPLAELAAGAEAIVRPRSTEEVSETLRWASAHGVGILPVGSGERVGRGEREGRYLVLAMDRLTGFEIYEPADLTLTAKAGTRLGEVNETLAANRQWLPFDPPDAPSRTLGGLVASGASGPVATGYGELRSHVLGATVVCGDGRVLRLGGRVVKNVAGFDLLRPVVGSRGRLGVVTSVCLRAFPVPAEDRMLVYRADDLAGVAEAARAVCTAPVLPASCVVWSGSLGGGAGGGAGAAEAGSVQGGRAAATRGAGLAVRLHGAGPAVDADQGALERHAGVSFERPQGAAALLEAIRDHASRGSAVVELSVLPSRLFGALAAARGLLGGEVEVAADAYGGSARLAPAALDVAAVTRLRKDVEGLGGALRVVRADGRRDAPASTEPSEAEVALAARVQAAFDPEGVLWPSRT